MTDEEIADTNGIVRETAREVERAAARARCIGMALLVAALACVVAITAFTGYAAAKARAQSQFNEQLNRIVQQYNEEHAVKSAESFDALRNNVACMASYFADSSAALAAGRALPAKSMLDACFKPTSPAPPEPPEPHKR